MATLTLNGHAPNESFIAANRGADVITRGFRWKSSKSMVYADNCYPVFNLTSDIINGVKFRDMSDDTPPYFVNGAHLGGNHAIVGGRITHVGHGKTSADTGSVWAKDGKQYVLIGVLNTAQILMAQIGVDDVPTVGTFTHVSGATNTSNIVASSAVMMMFHPMIENHSIRVFVDGEEIASDTGSFVYHRSVSFLETYDVVARDDVLSWFISNGAAGGIALNAPPLFSVSNSYEFDVEANLTIYSDFIARASATINSLYGVQLQHAGATHFYIPKSTAFTHDGVTKNYSLIHSAAPTTSDVVFNSSNTEAGGFYLDRILSMNSSYALAAGFAPIQVASPDLRRELVTGDGLRIATFGKAYMRAVNKNGHAVTAGECYSFVSYRNLIVRNSSRTAAYVVRTRQADFLYVDWHDTAKIDKIPLPSDLVGRSFTVFEKSTNVTVLSGELTAHLVAQVSVTGSYGYLVLCIPH